MRGRFEHAWGQYLRAQGLTHVVAPMGTRSGEAGHAMGGYRILLYPFHGGGNLWSRGLTDRQWIEYGQFLGKLHSIVPSPRIEAILRVENYSTTAPARVHARSAEAAVSDVLGALWQRYGAARHVFLPRRTREARLVGARPSGRALGGTTQHSACRCARRIRSWNKSSRGRLTPWGYKACLRLSRSGRTPISPPVGSPGWLSTRPCRRASSCGCSLTLRLPHGWCCAGIGSCLTPSSTR
ncbi:phosphotransferase [Streptomyces sp. NPDC001937]